MDRRRSMAMPLNQSTVTRSGALSEWSGTGRYSPLFHLGAVRRAGVHSVYCFTNLGECHACRPEACPILHHRKMCQS